MNGPIDPAKLRIPDDAWEFVEISEDFIVHRARIERDAHGNVQYVYRKAPRGIDALVEDNKRSMNDSASKRFGDGKIVASIPLNVLFDPRLQIAEKLQEGDRDHLKWFLNKREEALPFKRFRGTY